MDKAAAPATDRVELSAPVLLDDLKSDGSLFASLFVPDAETFDLTDPPIAVDPPQLLSQSGLAVIEELLRDFSRDSATFYSLYATTVREALDALGVKAKTARGPQQALLQLLVVLGESVELSAAMSAEGTSASTSTLDDLTARLRTPGAMNLLRQLFQVRPHSSGEDGEREKLVLLSIAWKSVEVHRIGTTSLILKLDILDSEHHLILKLVHFLFQDVAPLAQQTESYRETISALLDDCPHLVAVKASSRSWVIEEYIPGDTLAEYVGRHIKELSDHENGFRSLFVPLVHAVRRLHEARGGKPHGDLSPSNVLVQNAGKIPEGIYEDAAHHQDTVIRFIDLGRNFLASDTIGRVRSPDSHFIAPEARHLRPDEPLIAPEADYFSLGLLLAFCMGIDARELRSGDIPEDMFKDEPILARLMADLADPRPGARLAMMKQDFEGKAGDLTTLLKYLTDLSGVFRDARQRPTGFRSRLMMLTESLIVFRAPEAIIRRLAEELHSKHLPLAKQYRYLARWQRIAWLSWFACNAIVAFNLLIRYLPSAGFGRFSPWVGGSFKSALGHAHILVGSSAAYNQAAIVGASYAIAAYSYYMNAFSRVDLLGCDPRNRLRIWSEAVLRYQTMVVFPFVLVGNLFLPQLWFWLGTAGFVIVATNNLLMKKRQEAVNRVLNQAFHAMEHTPYGEGYWKRTIFEANDNENGGKLQITVSRELSDWVVTLFVFSVVTGTMALLLSVRVGHDYWVDAILLAITNLLFFTVLHATRQGPRIAPSLIRSAVLGERWKLVSDPAPEVARALKGTDPIEHAAAAAPLAG